MLLVDSSALVKRYVEEPGRDLVVQEMGRESVWCASLLCFVETYVALCRAVGDPDEPHRELAEDWAEFAVVPIDQECLFRAAEIGCARHVSTADAIHLAAAQGLNVPFRFLTFDGRQADAARALGLDVIDTTVC